MQFAKKKKRLEAMDILAFILMTFLVIIVFVPFYNTIVISFSTSSAYLQNPFSFWPAEFTWENYSRVIQNGAIFTGYVNSILVTVTGTLISMSTMVAGAFVFSRKPFPGKRLFFMMLLITMFFGGGMIPTYLNLKSLKLLDNRMAIILMCGVSTYNVIVLKAGFESIPSALEEAAKIDGANDIQTFFQIMLPLQKAQIATFTLFTAVGYWNEWFWSMLVINTGSKQPLMSYLRSVVMEASGVMDTEQSAEVVVKTFGMGIKMSTVMLTILPIMCVYPFLQKYFAKGVMVGSVKM